MAEFSVVIIHRKMCVRRSFKCYLIKDWERLCALFKRMIIMTYMTFNIEDGIVLGIEKHVLNITKYLMIYRMILQYEKKLASFNFKD